MDAFVELVGILIWPATIIFIVLVFKNQFSQLFGSIRRMKYKDAEIVFGNELAEIRGKIETLPIESSTEQPSSVPFHTPENKTVRELLTIHPAAAVMESWSNFEQSLRPFVQDGVSKNPMSVPQALQGMDLLDSDALEIYDRLRNLRNEIAHGGVGDQVSTEEALEFDFLAGDLAEWLQMLHSGKKYRDALTKKD